MTREQVLPFSRIGALTAKRGMPRQTGNEAPIYFTAKVSGTTVINTERETLQVL